MEFKINLEKFKTASTLIAGFYIGYNEGKGIDTSLNVEYLTKYGPTVFVVTTTPLMIKTINSFSKFMNKGVSKSLQNGNLEVTLQDGSKKKYKELNENERQEITPKLVETINNLESRLNNQKYLMPTLKVGTKTAIESVIGYTAGRIFSQFY